MSAVKAAIERVHEIIDALEAEGHKFAGELKHLFSGLAGDVPALEAEVKADVGQVVETAETQGVVPAEREAVADAAKLGGEVVHDVEAAAKGTEKTPIEPAHTPPQVAAVLAGEAAVASTDASA